MAPHSPRYSNRNKAIAFWVTEPERLAIAQAAIRATMSASAWIRKVLLEEAARDKAARDAEA